MYLPPAYLRIGQVRYGTSDLALHQQRDIMEIVATADNNEHELSRETLYRDRLKRFDLFGRKFLDDREGERSNSI